MCTGLFSTFISLDLGPLSSVPVCNLTRKAVPLESPDIILIFGPGRPSASGTPLMLNPALSQSAPSLDLPRNYAFHNL